MKTNPHKKIGLSRPCNANDLFLVSEGLQCGNCLALVQDDREMSYYKVTFDNGDNLVTGFNGSLDDAISYYVGKWFNLGVEDDLMTKGVTVEVAWPKSPSASNPTGHNLLSQKQRGYQQS